MLHLYFVFILFFLLLIGITYYFIYFYNQRIQYYKERKEPSSSLTSNEYLLNYATAYKNHSSDISILINDRIKNSYGVEKLLTLQQKTAFNALKIDFELDLPVAYHINQIYHLIQATPHTFKCIEFTDVHDQVLTAGALNYEPNQQLNLHEKSSLIAKIKIKSYLFQNLFVQSLPFQNLNHFSLSLNCQYSMNFLEFSKRIQYAQRLAILLDASLETPTMHETVEQANWLTQIYPWRMQSIHYSLGLKYATPLVAFMRTLNLLEKILAEQGLGFYQWSFNLHAKESMNLAASLILIAYLKCVHSKKTLFYFLIKIDNNDIDILQSIEGFNQFFEFNEFNEFNQTHESNHFNQLSKLDQLKILDDSDSELKNLQTIISNIELVLMPFEMLSQPIFYDKKQQPNLLMQILEASIREIFQHFEGEIYHHGLISKLQNQNIIHPENDCNSTSTIHQNFIKIQLVIHQKTLLNISLLSRQVHEYLKKYHNDWLDFVIQQKLIHEKYQNIQYQEDAWWQILKAHEVDSKNPSNQEKINHIKNQHLYQYFFDESKVFQHLRQINAL